ncbi:EF-hand domain-containing protein [Sedimentitalea sp. HM32M-2]
MFITAIVASAMSLTAVAALAMGPGRMSGHQASFQDLDADGSGEISPEEMAAHRDARFASADSDGDGLLSRAELEAAGQQRVAQRVARLIEKFDADKDGALSRDEMPSPRRSGRMFDQMDSDGSGGISQEEFDTVGAAGKGRMKRHHGNY